MGLFEKKMRIFMRKYFLRTKICIINVWICKDIINFYFHHRMSHNLNITDNHNNI